MSKDLTPQQCIERNLNWIFSEDRALCTGFAAKHGETLEQFAFRHAILPHLKDAMAEFAEQEISRIFQAHTSPHQN
jgi:hypothetical protein